MQVFVKFWYVYVIDLLIDLLIYLLIYILRALWQSKSHCAYSWAYTELIQGCHRYGQFRIDEIDALIKRWEKEVQKGQRVTCYGKACTELWAESLWSLRPKPDLCMKMRRMSVLEWLFQVCFISMASSWLPHSHRQWQWPWERCTMMYRHNVGFISDFWHPKCSGPAWKTGFTWFWGEFLFYFISRKFLLWGKSPIIEISWRWSNPYFSLFSGAAPWLHSASPSLWVVP